MDIDEQKYYSARKTLHFMLILSFINTGFYLLGELFSGISLPWMQTYYEAHPDVVPDEWAQMMERSFRIPQWYYLLSAVLDAASVIGLALMWRHRKNGFHCYTLAKLLLMLLPLLFLDRSYVGIGNIMLGILFIVYYFFLLKSMGVFSGEKINIIPADNNPDNDEESHDANNNPEE